ncbi:GNAT family N-acetyltransferase [Sphingomonas cavernae]|nr:GNAT family N-acetyltransferase [Sphingomonas cavernae]
MMGEPAIEVVEGSAVEQHGAELAALCRVIFADFAPEYLLGRLSHLDGAALFSAHDAEGRLIAFKLGYRRGETLFYSWLGGVHPDARRKGLARRLTEAQHRWAREQGYSHVETRTRAGNNAMIILNLQCGFSIVGFELDKAGIPVVIQRAELA